VKIYRSPENMGEGMEKEEKILSKYFGIRKT
jgi:hypothetical protein